MTPVVTTYRISLSSKHRESSFQAQPLTFSFLQRLAHSSLTEVGIYTLYAGRDLLLDRKFPLAVGTVGGIGFKEAKVHTFAERLV
jgi:hypothetical protein